jgi:hypothetical protein
LFHWNFDGHLIILLFPAKKVVYILPTLFRLVGWLGLDIMTLNTNGKKRKTFGEVDGASVIAGDIF